MSTARISAKIYKLDSEKKFGTFSSMCCLFLAIFIIVWALFNVSLAENVQILDLLKPFVIK